MQYYVTHAQGFSMLFNSVLDPDLEIYIKFYC